jgi:long-subunit fatty acid transport protein
MKRVLFALTILILGTPIVLAQSAVTRSAFNIEGTGARALGMGGAFIAIADDATAATWNPAGLAQLTKPEASLVYDHFSNDLSWKDRGSKTFDQPHYMDYSYTDVNDRGTSKYSDFSFVSATYPFTIGSRSLVTQFSYNKISNLPDFSNSYQYVYSYYRDDGTLYANKTEDYVWKGSPSGGINAYTISAASELFKGFNLGLSINYLKADVTNRYSSTMSWTEDWPGGIDGSGWVNSESQYDFKDWYMDMGVLYKVNDMFSIGAVYHFGFTTDINYVYGYENQDTPHYTVPLKGQVEWPDGWGVGVAFRPMPALTMAADYSKTNWSKATVKWDNTNFGSTYFPYFWYDKQFDTSSIRLGGEYALVLQNGLVIPLRGGLFREDQISTFYVGSGQVKADGFSLGTGVTYKNFQFDVAYVHSQGKEAQTVSGNSATNDGYTYAYEESVRHDTKVDRYLVSAIVRF